MIDWNRVTFWFVLILVARTGTKLVLEWINQRQLVRSGNRPPAELGAIMGREQTKRAVAYGQANGRFRILHLLCSDALLLALILSGALPVLNRWLASRFTSDLIAGLVFFGVPLLALILLDLPFSWIHTFKLEEKFGFNRSTTGTWVRDQIVSTLVSLLIAAGLLALVLLMIDWFPRSWWLWAVAIVCSVQLALTVLYPILIAPLFNRFEPIRDPDLEGRVQELMETAGVRLDGLYQMDASRRNRHTNAYFTGLGRAKRIVLYDTLLASHPQPEILAVLAHELGHYHRKHLLKEFFAFAVMLTAGFYGTQVLVGWEPFYRAFQFDSAAPYVGLFFAVILWRNIGFFVAPLYLALSRHFERQADSFAVAAMGGPESMTQALKRLASDNLSNLMPHPLYVFFHYSHPPLVERIAALEAAARRKPPQDMERGHSSWPSPKGSAS